jgi:hypothetical protein
MHLVQKPRSNDGIAQDGEMATSGTVGQTIVTVQNLIDSGARRAGKLAEELTVEQVQASKQSLYYVLSNLANIGIQYWCINKVIVGLIPDQTYYYLPVGTVDVLNANYRTLTPITAGAYSSSGVALNAFNGIGDQICQLTDNTGYIGINNGTGNAAMVTTIGMLPAMSGTVTVEIQYSQDNSNWTTLYAPGAVDWSARTWIYYDLQPTVNAPYWRILQLDGPNMGFYQVVFGTMPLSINMARMNRDDYSSLPNRSFTALRPLQYWFNRTIPQPNMELWPVPNSIQPQLELWLHAGISRSKTCSLTKWRWSFPELNLGASLTASSKLTNSGRKPSRKSVISLRFITHPTSATTRGKDACLVGHARKQRLVDRDLRSLQDEACLFRHASRRQHPCYPCLQRRLLRSV